jgi:hypothetical protein
MKQVALRLDDELAAAIDKARGEVPRERWIRERAREATVRLDASELHREYITTPAFAAHVAQVADALEVQRESDRADAFRQATTRKPVAKTAKARKS